YAELHGYLQRKHIGIHETVPAKLYRRCPASSTGFSVRTSRTFSASDVREYGFWIVGTCGDSFPLLASEYSASPDIKTTFVAGRAARMRCVSSAPPMRGITMSLSKR